MAGEKCTRKFWDAVKNPRKYSPGVICRSGGKRQAPEQMGIGIGRGRKREINRDRTVVTEDGRVLRYVWDTPIASYEQGGYAVYLRDGGHQTNLTKRRLNQVLPNDYKIVQRDFKWYLKGPDGKRAWSGFAEMDINGKQVRVNKGSPGSKAEKMAEEGDLFSKDYLAGL